MMISWRITLAILLAVGLGAAAIIAVVFQDNITRFNLNPQTPYQTYTPPPPPAYGARGAWALWPDQSVEGQADIFYIHSTTFSQRSHWNGPINARAADATLRKVAAPNEVGPFLRAGAVYGPRYRQATLFTMFTHKFDGLAARELAYRDIEAAFKVFLAERDETRPIILVGYGQGGLHVLGLLQHYFAIDEALQKQLAAAYIINHSVPMLVFARSLADIQPCRTPNDIRCVISYIDLEPGFEDEKRRYRKRSLIWDDRRRLLPQPETPLLCVNPLSWTTSSRPVSADNHLGAASATGIRMGEIPAPIAKSIGAQCIDGILDVSLPEQSFLRRRHWFGVHWRPQHFNLFYHDLAADAVRRTENLNTVLKAESRFLAPIGETVDLAVSPINKVPD